MISKKRRGSLANRPRRSGMDGSDPLDHDLAVQIQWVRRSNLSRTSWIGRPWEVGRAGGGAGSPETRSRGGAAPEKANWGLQCFTWAEVWPWRISVERVFHLWGYRGSGRSGAWSSAAMAAPGGEARRREACRLSLGLLCAQKGREVSVEQGQARARGTRDWAGLQDACHGEALARATVERQ